MEDVTIIHRVPTEQKAIAITFDDGPHPIYTTQLLAMFAQAEAKATFFMVGEEMEKFPRIAESVHEAGHELGNHTFSHPYLTKLEGGQIEDELAMTDRLIENVTGKRPVTFRPPYLDYNAAVHAYCETAGYRAVGAMNLAAQDWATPGVAHILDKTREQIASGSILLFHDGYGDRSQTVEAIRVLLPEIAGQGFRFVTVSELLTLEM
jgi:peptidoglycan/xylan/chitin deacetylase (PgdA/CDA1 family)